MHHWHQGRWQHATQRHSPNCDTRDKNESISLIVLHNISLPPFEYETDAVQALFTNQILPEKHPFFRQLVQLRVSSHFFISRKGQTLQFVSCDDAAYHAGVSEFHGKTQCNRFSIGIEIEGCDFEPYTETQYQALEKLLHAICQAYPIKAITGHQHIAPDRKTDPGHFFDWQRIASSGFPIDFNQATTAENA